MSKARLEHVNITVSDPKRSADLLCVLFDWDIRWQGPSSKGGSSVHVGSGDTYIALYSATSQDRQCEPSYTAAGGLNHVAVVVDDLELAGQRVREQGYAPYILEEYEPGRRFYFRDEDGIEFEVVSYG